MVVYSRVIGYLVPRAMFEMSVLLLRELNGCLCRNLAVM